jgi:hypothetical protein
VSWTRAVSVALAIGLLLRVGVACWNGLDGPSLGATADAQNFHRFAVAVSEGRAAPGFDLTGFSYAYALGYVYAITGPSLLIGSLLSCVAWLASALLLRASLGHLRVAAPVQLAAIGIYAMLPSSVLWTAVTLREPYQLLSVNLTLYAALRLFERRSVWYWVVLLAGVFIGSRLHATFVVAGALLIGLLLMREVAGLLRGRWARAVAVAAILVVVVFGGSYAVRNLYSKYNFGGGPAAAMERHLRMGMAQPSRTVYVSDPTVANTVDLVLSVPVALWRYLFEPMPWKMNRWFDIGFLVENLLRLALITAAVAAVLRSRHHPGWDSGVLLAWYLLMETVWAVGTFNWGTAARHHVPSIGLLLVAAAACWSRPPARPTPP